MPAISLVPSTIIHTRHQPVSHRLERRGLSLLINLDRLDEAKRASRLFSIGRFNLLSFDERDHGPNHAAGRKVEPLASYIRRIAAEVCPHQKVARVELLTFPRILGHVFNPISVYRCLDDDGATLMVVYEVRNTFGDMHAYIGINDDLHEASKVFHVSPFFPVEGGYKLKLRQDGDRINLAIRYNIKNKPALTATLRGNIKPLTSRAILGILIGMRLWPMRPLFSIHWEALKLWRKKVRFYRRPDPPGMNWSMARSKGNAR